MSTEQLDLTRQAVEPYPHEFIGLIPFSREFTSDNPIEGTDYIPYGSTLMTNLAYDLGWQGLHFDLNTFNYEAAIQNRDDMLNDGLIQSAWKIVATLENYDPQDEIFIRPSEDLKQFAGQVIQVQECIDWLKDAMSLPPESGSYALNPQTKLVIDDPKKIDAEWRWFIVDGRIVNGSMYKAHNQLIKKQELDEEVIKEAQFLADVWLPDSCVVMDTALVNGKVYVVEFNCINSSGFYGHDVKKIFKELYEYHT